MQRISRRAMLLGSAAVLMALAAPAMARTVPAPPPSRYVPTPKPGTPAAISTGQLNGVTASARGFDSQDALGIRVVLKNTNTIDKTLTVTYTDSGPKTKARRPLTIVVPAGQVRTLTIYGSLTHAVVIRVRDASGGSVTLPVDKPFGGGSPRGAGPHLATTPPSAPSSR